MIKRFTNRLRELRDSDLPEFSRGDYFLDILKNIEAYGLGIVHVGAPGEELDWSYSVGLYDTYGQPEIIVSGFPHTLSTAVLNEIARRYENGERLHSDARWQGLLGGEDYDCVFRTAQQAWVEHLMLTTCWFYGDTQFPAMQCICPDFSNKFPWEDTFDQRWRTKQALFFEGAERTKVEKLMWNSNERSGHVQ